MGPFKAASISDQLMLKIAFDQYDAGIPLVGYPCGAVMIGR